ncbi:rhodanese-like domain-containing protein [Flavivirga algicola]|uniref:Rhodanese-like domain-containing protein n=1 Tax=Flavivirga algicola TaxID=2729136 RepID=A0ABX1RTG9_9FLAO|nr:rhodanese-like domain-containing protein [Flavivirga algicola]NMH86850.1 rhodanese-like domain-containing protein [Flavivirga algicola]
MKNLLIIVGVVLLLYVSYRVFRYVSLDSELDKKIENGAVILDVRTETEFEMGHIEGSVNISLGSIRERYVELDTSKTYITCCSHGLRSIKVESLLKERGFKKVYNGGVWSDLEEMVSQISQKK